MRSRLSDIKISAVHALCICMSVCTLCVVVKSMNLAESYNYLPLACFRWCGNLGSLHSFCSWLRMWGGQATLLRYCSSMSDYLSPSVCIKQSIKEKRRSFIHSLDSNLRQTRWQQNAYKLSPFSPLSMNMLLRINIVSVLWALDFVHHIRQLSSVWTIKEQQRVHYFHITLLTQ